MTTADYRARLRFSSNTHDTEIEQKIAVADAELARVGINVNAEETAAINLLDYARELFLKAEFNFDGRGDRYAAQFEAVRDAMKLSSAYTETTPTQAGDAEQTGGGAGE